MVSMTAAEAHTTKEQDSAAMVHPPLSYAEYLSAQIALAKRKGERTRLRLKAAAARLLGEVGYRDLRVSDIHEDADVSNALFYVYFKNKEEISQEVLDGFLAFLEGFPERERPPETRFASIAHGNLRYAQMFQANAGLMRCVFQFGDEFPDFAAKWHAWNAGWRERTTRALLRQRDIALKDRVEIDVAVTALGSMVDAFLRLAFIEKEPSIAGTRYAGDPAALADLLTKLWLRALFAPDPEDGPAKK
jgi:AcrR family transcriptional regulator